MMKINRERTQCFLFKLYDRLCGSAIKQKCIIEKPPLKIVKKLLKDNMSSWDDYILANLYPILEWNCFNDL